MSKKHLCPKCGSSLKLRCTLFLSENNKIDVSSKSYVELTSYSGSGFSLRSKDTNINDFFSHSTGLTLLEEVLFCNKCEYEQIVSD